MSSSSDWHQKNWRIRAPLAAGREEKPAPNPSPAHTPRVWRNVDCQSTSETWQVVTQPTWTESVDTIAQSRRIYLGNLPYRIKPNEIEDMLVAEGFGEEFESIHISVDPVTGRNPGYCFINFKTGNGAQSALESLTDTSIQGRRIKIGPCQHKRVQPAGRSDDYTPTFQRWGDWKGSRPSDPAERCPGDGRVEQGPYGALDHIDAVRKADVPARVYFGGLGKMINQVENDREIRGYLDGFNVHAKFEVSQSANGSPLTCPQDKGPETTITALSISKPQRQRKKPSRQSVAESFLEADYAFEWLEDFRQEASWAHCSQVSERALSQDSIIDI